MLLGCATIAAVALGAPAAAAELAEYRAHYEVRHNGRRAADVEFSVVADGAGRYIYTSITETRGLLRLVAPSPVTERSQFRFDGNRLLAVQFDYTVGSRTNDDNYSIAFDAARSEVRITRADGTQTLPHEPELLDRGSLQVALMRDLSRCELPGPYRWVDDDGITTYRYADLGNAETDTGAGRFATVRFSQQREGSSRTTVLWLAPALGFLPVFVEQIRDGATETVYNLQEVTVITPVTADCSGFR
jgi:hypothetical protein